MKKSRSRKKKKLEEKILMQKRVDKPRPSDRSRFVLETEIKAAQSRRHALCYLRRRMNIELNFPPNFEGLVLGCIDADFCK